MKNNYEIDATGNKTARQTTLIYASAEEQTRLRLDSGHAWMICEECGGKLYDFDGHKDASRCCPYKKGGKCEP